ncbi:ABC-2 type transport system permease protein [Microbacterium sp. AK009]|uniref:ABC transporter permease n=1 Tax=Microbacterium sp. AK009 TaxID=2723068 RepID=UPI0015CCDF40|nr:ABC transporter permease [Microbacterium sp. AK009]NYF15559.1 ABC-2 type transport system permease protein [Microbacterium sp. AK009]
MTTATLSPTPADTLADARLTFAGTVRSEWIKLRSVRSTIWSYALLIAISIGLAALVAFALTSIPDGVAGQAPASQPVQTVVQASIAGVAFGQLIAGILGVLVISGEYTTGMVRSTFLAVPGRLSALAAKGIVLFTATFIVGLIANVAAYLVASLMLSQEDIAAPIIDPAVFWPLLGGALYLAMISLFALAIGALVRTSAGGIAVVVGILLILPTILSLIPADWAREAVPYLLSNAGAGIYSSATLAPEGDALGMWLNLLVTGLWVAVPAAAAAVMLRTRDA